MKTKRNVSPQVIKAVWNHWKPAFGKSKVSLAGATICYSLAMYISFMYRPTKWKEVFDLLVQKSSPWNAFTVIVISSIIGWAIDRIGEYFIVIAESNIIKELKDYSLNGLLGKSTEFFTNHPSGALVAKTRRFAQVAEMVIDEVVLSIIRSIVLIVYVVFYSWLLVPELTLTFIVWITVFIGATLYISKRLMRYGLESSASDSVTTGHLSDILLSVFTLRMFAAIPRVRKTFEDVTSTEKRKRRKAWLCENLQRGIQGVLVVILETYCMYQILEKVDHGKYSIGTIALIQSYILSLSMYMWGFAEA